MDPSTPTLRPGNVTHKKERFLNGQLETQNVHVHVHPDHVGATRIVYKPVGDHLESAFQRGVIVVTLLSPDATHWILHYSDPSGWTFSDESVPVPGGQLARSIDPSPNGPVVTETRFLDAPCEVVDAELARHPE